MDTINEKIKEMIPILAQELGNKYDKASDNDMFTLYTVTYDEHNLFDDTHYRNCTSRVLAPSKQAAIDYLDRDNLVNIYASNVSEEKFSKKDIEQVKNVLEISNAYHTYISERKMNEIASRVKEMLVENMVKILA